MNEAYRRFSPSTLHFGLTQSASKLHDESESLASAFAEGLPLDVATVRTKGRRTSLRCCRPQCPYCLPKAESWQLTN